MNTRRSEAYAHVPITRGHGHSNYNKEHLWQQ
jgi:hypothetical protein